MERIYLMLKRNFHPYLVSEDRFAFAQVACHVFTALGVVVVLAELTKGIFAPIPEGVLVAQRVLEVLSVVTVWGLYTAANFLIARGLRNCTKLVWRFAFGTFLLGTVFSVLGMLVKFDPYSGFSIILSAGGLVSVLGGRNSVYSA